MIWILERKIVIHAPQNIEDDKIEAEMDNTISTLEGAKKWIQSQLPEGWEVEIEQTLRGDNGQ